MTASAAALYSRDSSFRKSSCIITLSHITTIPRSLPSQDRSLLDLLFFTRIDYSVSIVLPLVVSLCPVSCLLVSRVTFVLHMGTS